MKKFHFTISLIGSEVREFDLDFDEKRTLREVVDKHYSILFPGNKSSSLRREIYNWSWNCLETQSIDEFNQKYNMSFFQESNGELYPIHLIDRLTELQLTNQVFVTNSGILHDDSIPFFLIEKYEGALDSIINHATIAKLRDEVSLLINKILSDIDAAVLLENRSYSGRGFRVSKFFVQAIPSGLWLKLGEENLIYYRHFIMHLAATIVVLNHCISNSLTSRGNIVQDIARGWVNSFLFKVQYLMMVLLSIPETFLRNARPNFHNYSRELSDIGVTKLAETDAKYCEKHINGRSMHEVCQSLLENTSIKSYYEYINYCKTIELADPLLSKLIHTFRIFFNRLKHASQVSIISTRDADEIRKRELEEINMRIESLGDLSLESEHDIGQFETELQRLKIRKELIEKVKYAFEHLDFDDQDFRLKNGINVADDANNRFRITFYDLEYSLRILVGILILLNRFAVAKLPE